MAASTEETAVVNAAIKLLNHRGHVPAGAHFGGARDAAEAAVLTTAMALLVSLSYTFNATTREWVAP